MRLIDTTGRTDIVPVPLRVHEGGPMSAVRGEGPQVRRVRCRKGWHLEAEPVADRATPSEEHKALVAVQANLVAA